MISSSYHNIISKYLNDGGIYYPIKLIIININKHHHQSFILVDISENKELIVQEEAIKNEEIVQKPIIEEIKFVSLINVAKIKGELLKSYLDKVTSIYSNIKLCRDDLNRIEIYYGPFKDNNLRNEIYKKLQENGIVNSYEVELTKEEFDKRCNY